MLWISETLLSLLRQRNALGWVGCVLCPCGLGGVCPFACGRSPPAREPRPRVAEGLWQRGCGRGAAMFALPALFPTLALYDDVPVLVAACSSPVPGKAWAVESKRSVHHTRQLQSPLPLFPACPSSPSIPSCTQGCVEGAGWVTARVCRFAGPGLVPALSVPSSPCDSTNESRCSFQARPHAALCGCSHFLFEYAISHTIAATAR